MSRSMFDVEKYRFNQLTKILDEGISTLQTAHNDIRAISEEFQKNSRQESVVSLNVSSALYQRPTSTTNGPSLGYRM